MHQIAPRTVGRAARKVAALTALALFALAPAGIALGQETGQPETPGTGSGGLPPETGLQTPAPGTGAETPAPGEAQTPAPGDAQTFGAQPAAPAPAGRLGRTTTAPPPPAEPGLEVRQYQDWAVRCGQPTEGAPETCEMVQQRLDEQGQTVLAVAVGKVPNTDDPGMLIILPLGIWLPPGVVIQVDGGEEVPARIERCERRGCQVELLLEPNILRLLRAGREANVLFHIYGENGEPRVVGVPFSLLGFTAALDEVVA